MVANRMKHKTHYKFDAPAIYKRKPRRKKEGISPNFQVDSTLIGIFHAAEKNHLTTIVRVIS